jgi:hypothetical protein
MHEVQRRRIYVVAEFRVRIVRVIAVEIESFDRW